MKFNLGVVFLATVGGLLAAGMTGCNGAQSGSTAGTAASTTSSGTASTGPLKVALITPGTVNDSGWNNLAYQGLQAIKTQLGAEVDNSQAEGDQITDALRTYAQKGYNVVFGHGFEYNAPAIKIASDFPKTYFITSSGAKTAPNVAAFRFYLEQGFYVAGAMAAKMSKTHVLGMIGGDQVPDIESTFVAFEAGAKAADPNVVLKKVYTGNGDDVAAAQQATDTLITQEHADFIIHQTNNAYKGVFDACKKHGVYVFGANSDQNSLEPGTVIASAVINCTPAMVDEVKDIQAGKFKGEVKLVGMDSGTIDFVINPALKSKIPADVAAYVSQVIADIKSGKITVPKSDF